MNVAPYPPFHQESVKPDCSISTKGLDPHISLKSLKIKLYPLRALISLSNSRTSYSFFRNSTDILNIFTSRFSSR